MVSCAACGRAESDSARFIGDKCVSKSSPPSSHSPGGKADTRALRMATGSKTVCSISHAQTYEEIAMPVYRLAIRDRSRSCSGFRAEANVHQQTDGSPVHQRLSRPVSNETFHSRGLQFNPLKGTIPYSCTCAVNPLTRFCMIDDVCYLFLQKKQIHPPSERQDLLRGTAPQSIVPKLRLHLVTPSTPHLITQRAARSAEPEYEGAPFQIPIAGVLKRSGTVAKVGIAEVDGEDHGRGEHPGVEIEGGEFGVNGRCGGNGAKSGRGSGFVAGREAGDMTNSKTLFSACRSPAVSCFVTQTQEEEGWG